MENLKQIFLFLSVRAFFNFCSKQRYDWLAYFCKYIHCLASIVYMTYKNVKQSIPGNFILCIGNALNNRLTYNDMVYFFYP